MKRLIKLASWVATFVLSVLLLAAASAQGTPPIKASLVASKTSYGSGEPIKVQVSVFNDSGGDVITRKDFLGQKFHLKITFTDPDGHLIRTRFLEGGPEPGPPFRHQGRDAALVEVVPPRDPIAKVGDSTTVIDDARVYYNLTKFGRYTAELFVSLETFSQYDTDPITGDLVAYLDDSGRQSFNPVASSKISFEILPPEPVGISAIQVQVNTLRVGGGVTPDTRRSTPEGVQIHLIRLSDISPDFQPINFKTYPVIWANVDPVHSTITNSRGEAKFEGVSQDDYKVIAHNPGARRLYVCGTIRANDSDWFTSRIDVQLRFMEKANGRTVAARTTRLRGSDLLITEPEYVEWESTEELYPFVFESVGDWGVTTSVSPPEGFVADNESLTAEVTNETEAVQFTITDVGSKWKETEVTYEVKHKGKTKKVKNKIGVKLSEKLAQQKGIGVYGHTPSPGPFKGGKKLGRQRE
jgi:hypothetical protein